MPSMFGFRNGVVQQRLRILTEFSPLKEALQNASGGGIGGGNFSLSLDLIQALNTINDDFTTRLANKDYSNIPNDFTNYLTLYDTVYQSTLIITNEGLLTLLNIALGGLKGAVEVYSLYTQNISLALNNNVLEQRIEEILSGKNEMDAMSGAQGTLSMTKTFFLAPLFSYYIVIYGMPEFGVGFDPKKLSIILDILNENGIDPYD
jgi:hypothetical protein